MIVLGVFLLIISVTLVMYACCRASGYSQPNDEYSEFNKFNDWEK